MNTTRDRSRIIQNDFFSNYVAEGEYRRNSDNALFGTLDKSHSFEVPVNKITESMSDNVTPAFSRRANDGEVIMNDMQQVITEDLRSGLEYHSNSVGLTRTSNSEAYTYNVSKLPTFVPQWHIDALSFGQLDMPFGFKSSVITKAYAKANASAMDTLTTIVEFRHTLRLLKTLGKRVSNITKQSFWDDLRANRIAAYEKIFRSSRKNRTFLLKRYARKGVIKSANEWLQYRYGIRQLMFDYQNSIALATSLSNPPREVFTSSDTFSVSEDLDRTAAWYTSCDRLHTSVRRTVDYEVTAGVVVQPKLNGLLHPIDATGITDIIPTLWEVTKLSFLVDWIVDVGSWLQAISPELTKDRLGSWVTVRRTDRRDGIFHFSSQPVGTSVAVSGSNHTVATAGLLDVKNTWKYKQLTHTREANPSMPLLPSFNLNVTVPKMVDIAALLAQAITKSR